MPYLRGGKRKIGERPTSPAKGARGASARPATGGAPRPPVAPGRTEPQRSRFKLRRPSAVKSRPTDRSRLRFGGR